MKIIDLKPSAIIGLPLALAVALLSGCSSKDAGSPTAQAPTPTVTATPTVTPSIVTVPAPTTATKAPRAMLLTLDTQGRAVKAVNDAPC